jgi:molecular chaperone GrpE
MSEEKELKQQEPQISEEQASEKGDDGENVDTAQQQNQADSQLDALQEELAKEKDKFLRLFAEFENYKKRTNRERMELFKTAGQEVIAALLPVMDDLDRAIKEMDRSGNEELFKGVELIRVKFKDTMRNKGLEDITVKAGDAFDPEVHDAVTQIPAPKKSLKGKVVDVIEKGYKLGDRIIRHPKVVVGN